MKCISIPKQSRSGFFSRIGFFVCFSFMICLFLAMDAKAGARTISFSMRVGQKAQLQLEGVTDSLNWTAKKGSNLIKLRKNGRVIAKRTGKVVIKVKYDNLTYRFNIKIRKKKKNQDKTVRVVSIAPVFVPKTVIPKANLSTITFNAKYPENMFIMIGDSRFLGMQQAVGGTATWIASTGQGLSWLVNTAVPGMKDIPMAGKVVVFNLGINDLPSAASYIATLNDLGQKLRGVGATVFFMTVNPVDEVEESKHGYAVKNTDIVAFNQALARSLSGFGIIDTYDYLADHGIATVDGVHYTADTYRVVYAVMKDAIMQ